MIRRCFGLHPRRLLLAHARTVPEQPGRFYSRVRSRRTSYATVHCVALRVKRSYIILHFTQLNLTNQTPFDSALGEAACSCTASAVSSLLQAQLVPSDACGGWVGLVHRFISRLFGPRNGQKRTLCRPAASLSLARSLFSLLSVLEMSGGRTAQAPSCQQHGPLPPSSASSGDKAACMEEC